ncbi:DUF6783 domain-containing protein [Blautia sp. HCP3S3_G3]
MRDNFPAKWGMHMTGVNFQTRSNIQQRKT